MMRAIHPMRVEDTHDDLGLPLAELSESVIKPVVRRKLRVSLSDVDMSRENQDALELVSEIHLRLLAELDRPHASDHLIRDLKGYAAAVAANACYQYFRSRFPLRARLKNKIRYLLSHHRGFAIWRDDDDKWICGYQAWKAEGRRASAIPEMVEVPVLGSCGREDISASLRKIFDILNAPVGLGELVGRLAGQNVHLEAPDQAEGDGCEAVSAIGQADIQSKMECRVTLRQLWTAILELPLKHRRALLLNLKDCSGESLIAALPLSRTAGIGEIAAAVDMPAHDFAALWNTLPWNDAQIAEFLAISRQQVINLRQSARARLARTLDRR